MDITCDLCEQPFTSGLILDRAYYCYECLVTVREPNPLKCVSCGSWSHFGEVMSALSQLQRNIKFNLSSGQSDSPLPTPIYTVPKNKPEYICPNGNAVVTKSSFHKLDQCTECNECNSMSLQKGVCNNAGCYTNQPV